MKIKRLNVKLIILAILSCGLHSCFAPKAVIRLEPIDQNTKWVQGRAYVRDSINGISVSSAFARFSRPYLIFEFDIINNSNLPLLVDPCNIFYESHSSENTSSDKVYAINPEDKILELDLAISKLEASTKSNTVIGLVAAGAGAVAAVSTLSENNVEEKEAVANSSFTTSAIAFDSAEDSVEDMINSDNERYVWENSTIRKTTLETNESMRGRVYFQINESADYYTIYFPVDNQELKFVFNQKKYYP